MGANGGIRIYKLKNVSEEDKALVKEHLLNSVTYIQELDGQEYLTTYSGSNLYFNGSLVDMYASYDEEKDKFDERGWNWEPSDAVMAMGDTDKKTRQRLHWVAKCLQEQDCILWEVWT